MLVLTRHIGQSIIIADNICVTILAHEGEKVRIGIKAPPDVQVDRSEIRLRRLAHPDGPPKKNGNGATRKINMVGSSTKASQTEGTDHVEQNLSQ